MFRSYLVCTVEWSYPFGGLTSEWQECDVCIAVSEWCLHLWAYKRWSLSEVRVSVAEKDWVVRNWSLSEVRTSVIEIDWAARRWSPNEVRTLVAEVDCLAICPAGRGRTEESSEVDVRGIVLEWKLPSSELTSIRFWMRGALSYRAG